jgi:hypothetical protein
MTRLSESELRAAWLIAIVIGAHLALFGLPFINFEWAFSDAAHYFENYHDPYLERYFNAQANTLGIPFLAFLLHKLAPIFDADLYPRLLATSGFVAMGVALLRLNRLLDSRLDAAILLAVTFFNPLVWTFGGRGTADFLPAALVLLGVVLFWEGPISKLQLVIATGSFSLAIILKYHAIVLLPLIWLEALSRPQAAFWPTVRRMSIVTSVILFFPIAYVLAVKHSFGFWLSSPSYLDELSPRLDLKSFVENYSAYVAHLFIQTLPLSLLAVLQQIRSAREFVLLAFVASGLFLIGFLFLTANGEMNFGPLDPYLDSRFLNGIFLASLCAFIPVVRSIKSAKQEFSDAGRLGFCVVVGAIIFIGVLSFSRPAQRYLIFILPLTVPYILLTVQYRKALMATTLALYLLINIYIGLNQYATGRAAADMTDKIKAANLLDVTDPGILAGHTGNRFPLHLNATGKYTVVAGTASEQIIVAESRPLPFIAKSFSLVPIKGSGPF